MRHPWLENSNLYSNNSWESEMERRWNWKATCAIPPILHEVLRLVFYPQTLEGSPTAAFPSPGHSLPITSCPSSLRSKHCWDRHLESITAQSRYSIMNTIVGKQNLKIGNMYSNSYVHTLKWTIIIKTESMSGTHGFTSIIGVC